MGQTNRGQIVVEYLLLLIVAVTIVALITKALVQRKEGDEPGVLIRVWSEMLKTIGQDPADEVVPQE